MRYEMIHSLTQQKTVAASQRSLESTIGTMSMNTLRFLGRWVLLCAVLVQASRAEVFVPASWRLSTSSSGSFRGATAANVPRYGSRSSSSSSSRPSLLGVRGGGAASSSSTTTSTITAQAKQVWNDIRNRLEQKPDDSKLSPFERRLANPSFFDKLVFGTTQLGAATVYEYILGFVGGYGVTSVVDIPRLLLLEPGQIAVPTRHDKALHWAGRWATLTTAYGGFRFVTKTIRGGKVDDWNMAVSSLAAGAFCARQGGPEAMLKGAVLYGGALFYLTTRRGWFDRQLRYSHTVENNNSWFDRGNPSKSVFEYSSRW